MLPAQANLCDQMTTFRVHRNPFYLPVICAYALISCYCTYRHTYISQAHGHFTEVRLRATAKQKEKDAMDGYDVDVTVALWFSYHFAFPTSASSPPCVSSKDPVVTVVCLLLACCAVLLLLEKLICG